jgi:hypothetical protein
VQNLPKGDDGDIFRVGVSHSLAFHCKILNMASNFDRRTTATVNDTKVKKVGAMEIY